MTKITSENQLLTALMEPAKEVADWKDTKLQNCRKHVQTLERQLAKVQNIEEEFRRKALPSITRLNELKQLKRSLKKSTQQSKSVTNIEQQLQNSNKKIENELKQQFDIKMQKQSDLEKLQNDVQSRTIFKAGLEKKLRMIKDNIAVVDRAFDVKAIAEFDELKHRFQDTEKSLQEKLDEVRKLARQQEQQRRDVLSKQEQIKKIEVNLKKTEQSFSEIAEDLPIWTTPVAEQQQLAQKQEFVGKCKDTLLHAKNELEKLETSFRTDIKKYSDATFKSTANLISTGKAKAFEMLSEFKQNGQLLADATVTALEKDKSALNDEYEKQCADLDLLIQEIKTLENDAKEGPKVTKSTKSDSSCRSARKKELLRLKKAVSSQKKTAKKLLTELSSQNPSKSSSSLNSKTKLEADFEKQMRLRRAEHKKEIMQLKKVLAANMDKRESLNSLNLLKSPATPIFKKTRKKPKNKRLKQTAQQTSNKKPQTRR